MKFYRDSILLNTLTIIIICMLIAQLIFTIFLLAKNYKKASAIEPEKIPLSGFISFNLANATNFSRPQIFHYKIIQAQPENYNQIAIQAFVIQQRKEKEENVIIMMTVNGQITYIMKKKYINLAQFNVLRQMKKSVMFVHLMVIFLENVLKNIMMNMIQKKFVMLIMLFIFGKEKVMKR